MMAMAIPKKVGTEYFRSVSSYDRPWRARLICPEWLKDAFLTLLAGPPSMWFDMLAPSGRGLQWLASVLSDDLQRS
jgi:hypothetical protein